MKRIWRWLYNMIGLVYKIKILPFEFYMYFIITNPIFQNLQWMEWQYCRYIICMKWWTAPKYTKINKPNLYNIVKCLIRPKYFAYRKYRCPSLSRGNGWYKTEASSLWISVSLGRSKEVSFVIFMVFQTVFYSAYCTWCVQFNPNHIINILIHLFCSAGWRQC